MKRSLAVKAVLGLLLCGGATLLWSDQALAIDTLLDYQKQPPFVTAPIQPLTMLLLDNTGSMGSYTYTSGTYDSSKSYYGLFETKTTAGADVYYYHPFNVAGTASVCNYTGISGSCTKSTGATGECTYPTRTCTTMTGGKYTCYRPAGTVVQFNNATCDGSDSGSGITDCQSGEPCAPHNVNSYTCRTSDTSQSNTAYGYLNSGQCRTSWSGSNKCNSGYTCTAAYYCGTSTNNGPYTALYDNNTCDANNDGNSDCTGSNTCRRAQVSSNDSYGCFISGGDSGTYTTSACGTGCSGSASCVVKGTTPDYWSCKTVASGDGGGSGTGTSYNTLADCNTSCNGRSSSGYTCVAAYNCPASGNNKYFGTNTCATFNRYDDDTSNRSCGGTCSATGTSNPQPWTGQTWAACTAIGGTPKDTGFITDDSYNCLVAPGSATCSALADSVCNNVGNGTSVCEWTDLLQKAACIALGGTCTGDTLTGPGQASCATAADITACQGPSNQKYYLGTCETGITYSSVRAPYWRKTPGDATNAPGWDCTTADCTGAGANKTVGNKLNFTQMTQMDVAKKALIGGKRAAVSSIAGTIELDGDYNNTSTSYVCSTTGNSYSSKTNCTNSGCTSANCLSTTTGNNGNIVLQLPADDPNYVVPEGILQKNSGLAWGFGVLYAPDGGIIKSPIGTANATIVQQINDTNSNGSTDLAESMNTVVNYFRQSTPEYNSGEYTVDTNTTGIWDPFIDDATKSFAPCARASCIVITDGEPNQDDKFNTTIKNYANNSTGISDFITPTSGTNTYFVDDVAYWAHKNDLRSDAQLGGDQKMDWYFIYAFGNDATSAKEMQNAAVLGGFTDKNKDGKPNTRAVEFAAAATDREWASKSTAATAAALIPDNYADASAGDQLAVQLQNMLGQVQQKAAAGSAASVISASRSGEGAIFQAIFYAHTPPETATQRSITWVGDLHSLWLDDAGNMREDCNAGDTGKTCSSPDYVLNPKTDKIVEFFNDPATGAAKIRTFTDLDGDNKYIAGTCSVAVPGKTATTIREFDCQNVGGVWDYSSSTDFAGETFMKSFTHWLWSAGDWLATPISPTPAEDDTNRAYNSPAKGRYIFTQDSIAGGAISFTTTALKAALGLANYKQDLAAADETTADNFVKWVRGNEITGMRGRVYDWENGAGAVVNKLGDIIGSTPTLVAKPAEDYDIIYGDESYKLFRKAYDQRRTMIYAGGNDGGLHAFNGGYFDRTLKQYLKKPPTASVSYDLGGEMWMYIPKGLLPHLKWLTDVNYNHVYYVDMRPYIFDAKIFQPDSVHVGGWGTVLVGGMGFGGGDAHAQGGTTFRSSYFFLDVTNPEQPPVLLGEFSDPNLGFTLAAPTAIPMLGCDRKTVGSCTGSWPMDWYLALGSGPHSTDTSTTGIQSALAGRSDQAARVYVLKLGGTSSYISSINVPAQVLGSPWIIPVAGSPSFPKSYFSDMIAVDYDLNFKTDAIYFGSVANTDKAAASYFTGGMHRLVTKESTNTGVDWSLNTMFNAAKPVSAAPTVAYDGSRVWVYFGTGRLLEQGDKSDVSQQTYFGLKESYDINNKISFTTPNAGNLVNVTNVAVGKSTGILYDRTTGAATDVKDSSSVPAGGASLGVATFKELNYKMDEKLSGYDHYNGWKLDFPRAKERNLGQGALLGEVLTFTTHVPSSDVCSSDGESYLWALYYRTGTAYTEPIIGTASVGGKEVTVRETYIGRGLTLTPSVHTGSESGSKAFVQTSTGTIIGIEQKNPGATKSGVVSWRDRDPD